MPEIMEIKGVGPVLGLACTQSGYNSVKKLAAASVAELSEVPGVGQAKARSLIAAAQLLLGETKSSNGAMVQGPETGGNASQAIVLKGKKKTKSKKEKSKNKKEKAKNKKKPKNKKAKGKKGSKAKTKSKSKTKSKKSKK